MSATSFDRPVTAGGFSDFFRTFFGAAAGAETSPASGGRGSRPVGGASFEDILAGLNLDGGGQGQAAGRARSAAGQVTSEADVEIGLEEAFHGTSRLLEVDGKRLEVAVPRGVETGSRIRLRGKGADGGDLDLVTRVRPHADVRAQGRRPDPRPAADASRGAARRRGPRSDAQGQGPPQDPGRAPRPAAPFGSPARGCPGSSPRTGSSRPATCWSPCG